ncbi:MAG TPA: 3-dehydroquinate synthase, partial [Cyclobacteriaceae bacterium]|nr:3-dehydroquinate synthase [Cyclobacteriaceae bacterium]
LISNESKWREISQKPLEKQNWDDLIDFSYQFKSGIAETDPYEGGVRKVLNFGHTIGHAVESCCLTTLDPLFHGEAIAIGMIAEAQISCEKGLLSKPELDDISAYVTATFGKKKDMPSAEEIIKLMAQDKKNKGNTILMALLERIGHAVWDMGVSETEIRNSLDYYHSL